jgi:hypothetical protein
LGTGERSFTILGQVNRTLRVLAESAANILREPYLIFNKQNPHAAPPL